MKKPNIKYSKTNSALAILFICIIFVPCIFFFFGAENKVSDVEKRKLAAAPAWPGTLEDIAKFPGKFDAYFADHFGFRERIIGAYNFVKFKIGDSPTDDIMIGRDGWLYLGSARPNNKYENVFDSALKNEIFQEPALEAIASHFEQKRIWLADQGIEYVFVIAPEKHSVYPEYLPYYLSDVTGDRSAKQVTSYLQQHTQVKVLDLLPVLLKQKKDKQVYYKTDTHWNHDGAYAAFKAIMDVVNSTAIDMPNNTPVLDVNFEPREKFRGDISNFVNVNVYDEYNPGPVFSKGCAPTQEEIPVQISPNLISRCEGKQKDLLFFGDSFSQALVPYFSRSFQQMTYVRDRPSYETLESYIGADKPDIIIEEWVERYVVGLSLDPDFIEPSAEKLFQESTFPILTLSPERYNPNKNMIITDESEEQVTYKTQNGASGYLHLQGLDFQAGRSYVLEVDLTLTKDSVVQLFFSDSEQTEGPPYSKARWLRQKASSGQSKLYFHLGFENLGPHMRLHPSLENDTVTIRSISIREVEGRPIAANEETPASPY